MKEVEIPTKYPTNPTSKVLENGYKSNYYGKMTKTRLLIQYLKEQRVLKKLKCTNINCWDTNDISDGNN